jgi:outer membrane protein, heavy metal efflux system
MRKMKGNNWVIMYFCGLLLVAFTVLPLPVFSQKLTLDEVLNKIELANPSLLSYQSRINAINAGADGARAWMPPIVGLEWDMFPYNFKYENGSMLRFSAMQDFPNPRKNNAKESYMRSMAESEKHLGTFYKVELFARAKGIYYKIYVTRRKIGVLRESGEALKLMINLATKQMAITKGDLASVYRLKARLAENETMIVHEENEITAFFASLNYLMNEDVNRTFNIDTLGLMKDYRGLSTYVNIDSLDCKRSDIMRMNSEINTLKLNREYMQLQRKPEFGMKVEHYQRFDMPDAFSVMGTMTIPSMPWSAKAYKSDIRAIDYNIQAIEEDKKNMTNMARQMIKMYLVQLASEYRELDNYNQKVIPAYRQSLDANLLAYGQNTNDMNMTLLAWDDLLAAQLEYIKHLDTYFNVQAEYEKQLQVR